LNREEFRLQPEESDDFELDVPQELLAGMGVENGTLKQDRLSSRRTFQLQSHVLRKKGRETRDINSMKNR
jgi:hypothetical protein